MVKTKLASFVFFIAFCSGLASAQDLTRYNWYFGNNIAPVLFNKSDTMPVLGSTLSSTIGLGGTAVATNPVTGNILFYADPSSIYDATHATMTGAVPAGGNLNANQSVAISPIPGSDSLFYVLRVIGGDLFYDEVDMKLMGGALGAVPFGEVTLTGQATGITTIYESILVIGHPSMADQYLLITQNSGTETIEVYTVQAGGVFVASGGTYTPPVLFEVANFSFSPTSRKIAVSPRDQVINVQVLDIALPSGVLTFDQEVFSTGTLDFASESIYDTEWSADGSKLYISRHGGVGTIGDVLQFDMSDPTITLATVLPTPVARSFGLLRGPDNNIYHLYQAVNTTDPFQLSRIIDADSSANLTTYELTPLGNGDFRAMQFPEFSPTPIPNLNLSIKAFDFCLNNETKFFPIFATTPTGFSWDFGDGTGTSNDVAPRYEYTSAGNFTVQLTAMINGLQEVATLPVNILDNDLMINLPDTAICPGETLLLDATNENAISYLWSTDETTPTISIDSAATYWVIVTHNNGCTAYDAAVVKVVGEVVDQRFNIWFFGNQAGIDFNETPALPLAESIMDAPEGCAVISDVNGNDLFYTDGQTVYNREHMIMQGGTDIGGDPGSSQSAFIRQFPDDETLFYIFYTEEVLGDNSYRLGYAIVDLKGDNGLGSVEIKNADPEEIFLYEQNTERLVGNDNFIITHEYGNNTFRIYPYSNSGLGNPILSTIGAVHSFSSAENAQGYMKLSGSLVAVVIPDAGGNNAIEIFTIDGTGTLTDLVRLDLGSEQPYGIEFGGEKFFVSVNDAGTGKVYEYRIDSLVDEAFTNGSKQLLIDSDQPETYGSIQLAPNGQMFMAVEGKNELAVINVNSDTLQLSTFTLAGFALAGGTSSHLGLPNTPPLSPPPLLTPSFSATNGCINDPLTFSVSRRWENDSILWDMGDGTIFRDSLSLTHMYPTEGTYTVTVTLTRCEGNPELVPAEYKDVFTQDIIITAPPTDPILGNFVAFCNDPIVMLDADNGEPGLTYQWTLNGDTISTVSTVQPTILGDYIFTIFNGAGCNLTRTVNVFAQTPFNIGPDITVCQNEVTPFLNTNVALPHSWSRDDGDPTTSLTNLQSVNTSIAGVFRYVVTVIDTFETPDCLSYDTLFLTVQEEPDITITSLPTTGCGVSDGQLDIDFNILGNFSYDINGPENRSGSNISGPSNTIPNETLLPPGTYTVSVLNNITGCQTQEVTTIDDGVPDFAITSATAPDACDAIGVDVILDSAIPVDYIFTNTNSGQVVGPFSANGPNFTTQPISVGSHTLEITSAACVNTIDVTIGSLAISTFSILQDPCRDPNGIVLTIDPISNSENTRWYDSPDLISPISTNFGLTVSTPGRYYLVANLSGFCTNIDSVIINEIIDTPEVSVAAVGEPCDGSIQLDAIVVPNGSYAFTWFESGVATGDVGPNLTLSDPSESGNYSVNARNIASACEATSSPLAVEVFEPIALSILPPFACDDGQLVTLEAITTASDLIFQWTDPFGFVIQGETSSIIEVDDAGLYIVKATSANGCTMSEFVSVVRRALAPSELIGGAEICNLDTDPNVNSVLIDADPNLDFVSYNWTLDSDPVFSSTDREIVADEEGYYKVAMTNIEGCERMDSVFITNSCVPKINAPTAFSPNGNDQNDEFFLFPKYVSTEDFEIIIFNRWGEPIYRSENRDFRWNGVYNGKKAPVGSYAYVVKFKGEFPDEPEVFKERGGVAVIR